PEVWRCILVPETITLAKLHVALQWTMGRTGGHLHEYEIARRRYGVPDPEWPEEIPLTDERRVRLSSFIEAGVRRFTYLYDFGDGWEHVRYRSQRHGRPARPSIRRGHLRARCCPRMLAPEPERPSWQ